MNTAARAQVEYCRDGDIAVITIENPPVNVISQAVRAGLIAALDRLKGDSAATGAVLRGAGGVFVAGADISEFRRAPEAPLLGDCIQALAGSCKPVVALVDGVALGGGLELALACAGRIATPRARLGFPEINLGLIPGAQGTQRAPRLVGMETAAELILSGKPISAGRAAEIGLIDAIIAPAEGLAAAQEAVRRLAATPRTLADQAKAPRDGLLEAARKAARLSPGQAQAAEAALQALQAAADVPLAEGAALERALFAELKETEAHKALRHAFLAERQVAHQPGLVRPPRPVGHIGVVGGGTMGVGIAAAALLNNLPVTLVEMDEEAAGRARQRLSDLLEQSVSRGKLKAAERDEILSQRFTATAEDARLEAADLVIEAVFEDLDVKHEVFARLDRVTRPDTVLASNTSFLDIDRIAAATGRPDRVLGLHFFSPAHVMKLLEVIPGAQTSPETLALGFDLARRLKKTAVRAGNCDGFIGNRILAHYREAADLMVLDGASPYRIDAALQDFGFAMGPFAVGDMAGLDIGWAMRKRRAADRDPALRYAAFADRICENGWFGRKTGRGFYRYAKGAHQGLPDLEVEDIIAEERARHGIVPRAFGEAEIVEIYMAAMINEAAKVVGEGIARRPLDVDVVFVSGFGFPRWRGGPLHYADTLGAARVLDTIRRQQDRDPGFWAPAPLLEELASGGGSFADLDRAEA